MRRALPLFAIALASLAAAAQAPEVTLTRLECGTRAPLAIGPFSDTYDYGDLKQDFVFSCYLVKHGDQYLVWDTGNAMGSGQWAPKTSLVDQLAQLGVKPEQVTYVGISHYHNDHTGQVGSLPKATLLIGKGDWEVVTAPKTAAGVSSPFASWIGGEGKVEQLPGDRDVFKDGTVVLLYTPGHTPGHHSILVKLAQMGPVLITGDLAHFHENYDRNGVPSFNTDRAQTIASLERFKKIAANLKATVIIQHDPRDVGKLPAFPAAAK
jgi:glyoxylase-like metal-dependent hydrolase (beta-lactamase superfamily II)